jgi:hypothetical protein
MRASSGWCRKSLLVSSPKGVRPFFHCFERWRQPPFMLATAAAFSKRFNSAYVARNAVGESWLTHTPARAKRASIVFEKVRRNSETDALAHGWRRRRAARAKSSARLGFAVGQLTAAPFRMAGRRDAVRAANRGPLRESGGPLLNGIQASADPGGCQTDPGDS